MSQSAVLGERLARHRVKAVVVSASVAVHAVLLVAVGMKAGADMSGRPAAPEPLYIRIEPRPLMTTEVEREPPLTVIDEPRETLSPGRVDPASLLPDDDEENEEAPASSIIPPSRSPASSATDSRAQGVDPLWRVQPESAEARLARGRAEAGLDCNRPAGQLTDMQRAACARRLLEARDAPGVRGSGDPERDAAFARQGAANIRNYDARRAPLAGGTGVVGPDDCPGSNLGMGCAGAHLREVQGVDMRQGARTTHTPTQQRSE